MFDHVTVRVADRAASERFYAEVLGSATHSGEHYAEWGDFSLAAAAATSRATEGLSIVLGSTAPGFSGRDPDGTLVETDDSEPPGSIVSLRIAVADLAASTRFYETIAPHAGIELASSRDGESSFAAAHGTLTLVESVRPTRNVHLAFPAAANAAVDAFHAAALAAGHRDNGAPGERAVYHDGYYGAFVLDPDGNNVEVVNHNR